MSRQRMKLDAAASDPRGRARRRPGSMYNGLMSSKDATSYDQCRGIHGAARARKSAKHATSCARRRNDRVLIAEQIADED